MSVLVRFAPEGMTRQQYDRSMHLLEERGALQADGLAYHVCYGSDGNLRVAEIWDSTEQLEAFGERLMPILAEAGIRISAPPEISEVQNVMQR